LLIGLTGSFGSGKSTVSEMFRELGATVVSADELVHEFLGSREVKEKIRETFGGGVFRGPELDRKELAKRIFASESLRRRLEQILHPLVYEKIKEFQARNPEKMIIAEIPLLFETGKHKDFDFVILVACPEDLAIKRLEKRGFTRYEALERLRAQIPLEEKMKHADFIVDNSGSVDETKRQVKKIWDKLKGTGGA